VLVTSSTLGFARRDRLVQVAADAHIDIGRTALRRGIERSVSELLLRRDGDRIGLRERFGGARPSRKKQQARGRSGPTDEVTAVHARSEGRSSRTGPEKSRRRSRTRGGSLITLPVS